MVIIYLIQKLRRTTHQKEYSALTPVWRSPAGSVSCSCSETDDNFLQLPKQIFNSLIFVVSGILCLYSAFKYNTQYLFYTMVLTRVDTVYKYLFRNDSEYFQQDPEGLVGRHGGDICGLKTGQQLGNSSGPVAGSRVENVGRQL